MSENDACRAYGSVMTKTAQAAGTVLSSSSGAGLLGANCVNRNSRGARATIVIANKTGTIDAVFTLRRRNADGSYIDMLSSSSLTGNGTTVLTVHPDLTTAANSIAKDFIGAEFDVKLVSGAGSSPSFDVTVSVELLP